MRPFEHIDSCDIRDHGRRRGPAALLCTRFYGGSATTQANPTALTTSGAASPLTSGNGASATSGSIALGAGSKYQESGSIDLSGANLQTVGGSVTATTGSTVNIGDQGLDQAISGVINSLSSGGSIPVSLDGGGALGGGTTVVSAQPDTSSSSWLDNINWNLVAIIGAGTVVAIAVMFLIFEEKK